jgi:hypothetical protein
MEGSQGSGAGVVGLVIPLAIMILMIASWWKVFSKAGKPGWAAIVPIYNAIVFLEVAGRPAWWVILMLIPVVNIVVGIVATVGLAQRFGKGMGFTILLLLLPIVGYPILGFGSAEYQG